MAKKLIEVVNGDFRYSDYEMEAQRWLKKIEVLNKRTPEGEDVKFEDLEKLIIKLQSKYDRHMQWINLVMIDDELPWYSVSIINEQTKEREITIYALTMYELYCKVTLYLFASSRRKDG